MGEGVPRSMTVAECLYRIGAEMGNPLSQWNLSNILKNKPGIDPESLYWTERAAAQGDPVALGLVGYIISINPYEDAAEGLAMMMVAAELGDKYASERIAEAEALVGGGVEELLHRARLLKPNWRATPEAPPAKFRKNDVSCVAVGSK
jgi:TPR repeat protein